MKEQIKEQFLEGSLNTATMDELLAAANDDSSLVGELGEQVAIDGALQVFLGPDRAGEAVVAGALERLRGGERRKVILFPPRLRLVAAAAAAVAIGIATGWVSIRMFPESGVGPDVSRSARSGLQPAASPAVGTRSGEGSVVSPWLEQLAAADATEIAELYAEIAAGPAGPERDRDRELAILRWAELDPHGALEFLTEERGGNNRFAWLFAGWAREDPDAAWEAAAAIEDNGRKAIAQKQVLAWLSRSDPVSFASLAPQSKNAAPHWRMAFRTLAKEGDLTAEHFDMLNGEARHNALAGAAEGFAEGDFRSALEWANAMPETGDREVALTAAFTALGRRDPAAAGRELTALDANEETNRLARAVAKEIAQRDGAEAFDWARQFGRGATPEILREVLHGMVKQADSRALGLLATLVRDEGSAVFRKDHRLDDIFWVSRGLDYTEGLRWVMEEAPRDAFGWSNMIRGMVFSWSKEDPAIAGRWVHENLEGRIHDVTESMIIHQMISTSRDVNPAWEMNLNRTPGPERGRMAVRILERHAEIDPASAAQRLAEFPAEADRARAVGTVASYWGAYAPNEAARWAAELQDAAERASAHRAIASGWAGHDSYQAADWVGALPAGNDRDAAAEGLVAQVAPYEADSAFSWAMVIQDPAARARAAEAAAEAWRTQDVEAARAGVQDSSLSPPEKARLLEVINAESSKETTTTPK